MLLAKMFLVVCIGLASLKIIPDGAVLGPTTVSSSRF